MHVTVAEIIRKKYPVGLNLPPVDQSSKLHIKCDDEAFLNELRKIMDNMSVREGYSSSEYANVVNMNITRIGSEYQVEVERISGKRMFQLNERNAAQTCAWIGYALVTDGRWLPERNSKIILEVLSAPQQTAALKLKGAIMNHYADNSDLREQMTERLETIIKHGVSRLLVAAPRYYQRPVNEDGFKFLSEFGGLFARKKTLTVEELAENMYGNADFKHEIESYVSLLHDSDKFTQAVNKCANDFFEYIYKQPLIPIQNTMNDVFRRLKEKYSRQEWDVATEWLENEYTVKKLDIEGLKEIFEGITNEYLRLAKRKMSGFLCNELVDMVSKRYDAEKEAALRSLKEVGSSLETLCCIDDGDRAEMIPWNAFAKLDADSIPEGDIAWTESTINSVTAPLNFAHSAILCGRGVYEMETARGVTNAYRIPGMSDGLIAVVYTQSFAVDAFSAGSEEGRQ